MSVTRLKACHGNGSRHGLGRGLAVGKSGIGGAGRELGERWESVVDEVVRNQNTRRSACAVVGHFGVDSVETVNLFQMFMEGPGVGKQVTASGFHTLNESRCRRPLD